MLVKKELLAVEPAKMPAVPKKQKMNYSAAVHTAALKRSGTVLVVDLYRSEKGSIAYRFFTDGNSFQILTGPAPGGWTTHHMGNLLRGDGAYCSDQELDLANEFLNLRIQSYCHRSDIVGQMDAFASGIATEKRSKEYQKRTDLMKEHFDMYPKRPENLVAYCEDHVFDFSYIFIDKVKDGKRRAVCGHCGKHFAVDKSAASGKTGLCPHCGKFSIYRGSWFTSSITNKEKICIAAKVDGQLLLRWTDVTRTFTHPSHSPKYDFSDYAYNLHLNTKKGPQIYCYKYQCVECWGWNWYRKKNEDCCIDESYVYTDNLDEVFGDSYYNVNLKEGLAGRDCKMRFHYLLKNLRLDPGAEYLFKLKMPMLASQADSMELTGKGFSNVLGVSKQMLPLYSKFNVSLAEHRIIKGYGQWVSDENFEALREMKLDKYCDVTLDALKYLSLDRFAHYFRKQKAAIPKKTYGWLITEYTDYISMSATLKVDLSHKSVLMPKNVVDAHDTILPRFNAVKHAKEDAAFREAVGPIYEDLRITEFKKDGFCIILPQLRSDLITEGQSLNHCVGGDNYYKRHIAGTNLIFFIRRENDPQKPFFTMEVEMSGYKIRQLYGFGDCSAPKEVREFADSFVRKLRPTTAERKTA